MRWDMLPGAMAAKHTRLETDVWIRSTSATYMPSKVTVVALVTTACCALEPTVFGS